MKYSEVTNWIAVCICAKTRHNHVFLKYQFIKYLQSTQPSVCFGKISASYANIFVNSV